MKAKLKECPFCTGHAELRPVYDQWHDPGGWYGKTSGYFVKCYSCGATVGVYKSKDEAAWRWNRRGGEPIHCPPPA